MAHLVQPYLKELKASFKTQVTKSPQWRKQQLTQLLKGVTEQRKQMEEALVQDLGRHYYWTDLSEINNVQEYCQHHIDNLDDYMQEIECDPPLIFAPASSHIRYEPLGVALIMGSWNFPYFVTLKPLVSAITAGNCAIVKPSEIGVCSAQMLQLLIEKYLDPNCYKVIQGEADVCIELTKSRFDIICFTGSTEKGKLVAKAAAANLVPCILELGGKCPFICDDSTDYDYAAMKAVYGKFQNAGQTCIGVDYVLVPESKQQKLVTNIMKQLKKQFGIDQKDPSTQKYNDNVGKVINQFTIDRLKTVMENSGGQVLVGGIDTIDIEQRYICPTVILNPSVDSQMMTEEIFGPILPIITYKDFDEVVDNYVTRLEKPLAVYYAGNCNSANWNRLLKETSSGNITANDVLHHATEIEFGFGGVGHSGYGRVGGYEAFKLWSNGKSISKKYQVNFFPYNWVCPPYNKSKIKVLNVIMSLYHIKQNSFFRNLFKMIFVFLAYMICFGKLGQSKFRRELVGQLIAFLRTLQ